MMASDKYKSKAPVAAWVRSWAETPWLIRNALTKTVASNTGLGMAFSAFVLAEGLDLLGNPFFLRCRREFPCRLLSMDAVQEGEQGLAGFLAVDHTDGFEQNPLFDSVRLQVIAFGQPKAPAQFCGQGDLAGAENL